MVVASLALGIGANTAIYSFMEAILLRPLPVADPESLVVMKWRAKGYAMASIGHVVVDGRLVLRQGHRHGQQHLSVPGAAVFQEQPRRALERVLLHPSSRLALTAQGETEPVKGQYVSGGYFEGIGDRPGRRPADSGAATTTTPPPAWRSSAIGSAAAGSATHGSAVGQTVRINDKPFSVIGVAPASFFGAEPGAIPDVYIPMQRRRDSGHRQWQRVISTTTTTGSRSWRG